MLSTPFILCRFFVLDEFTPVFLSYKKLSIVNYQLSNEKKLLPLHPSSIERLCIRLNTFSQRGNIKFSAKVHHRIFFRNVLLLLLFFLKNANLRISEMKKILGMGNALVDILMRLRSDDLLQQLDLPKGSMQLIDEAKMREIQDATLLLGQHVVTGGSASNAISGLARLGVDVGFIGKVGCDSIGDFFRVDSFENGVLTYLMGSKLPSGRCHVLISPDSERTMCTYLGAASCLAADDLKLAMFRDFDVLHIEGYMVESHDLMLRAAQLARRAGLEISLDLASYNVVDAEREFLRDYTTKYVDIVFANEEEAFAFTGKNAEEAALEIGQMCRIAVVKVGKRGSFVVSGSEFHQIPAAKVACIDSTGAGDLYAAGFLYGYARGLSLDKCARIGTICAGHVITFVGAKMDDRTWQSINAIVGNF